jgi:2-octaprenyl-6-methoxyphenol hydroxylase
LNLGLRDVHELVSKLRWSADHRSALRRVDGPRPDRWAMIAATDFCAQLYTGSCRAASARGLGTVWRWIDAGGQGVVARRVMFGSR